MSYKGVNMNLKSLALTVILTAILVNCGTNKIAQPKAYQVPEAVPYVEMLDSGPKVTKIII